MKRIFKKTTAATITLLLLLGMTTSSFAAEATPSKEETVYVLLQGDGNVNSIYTVNSFNLAQAGQITDYGDYSAVRNMTTTETIQYADGMATANAPAGKFYYQGNMVSKQIPWDIGLEYKLDGKSISADALAGQSGALSIIINIAQNKQVPAEYFEHYTLQISLSLDTKICSNIEANGSTIANAGNKKSINFTHLTNTVKSYTINTDVVNFEMDPIQFNALLLTMQIQMNGLDALNGGFDAFSNGVGELNKGAASLKQASTQYNAGMAALSSSGTKLTDSSKQINQGLGQSSAGLSALVKNSAQLQALATALSASSDPQVQALAQGYLAQITALQQLSTGIAALSTQYGQFDTGLSEYATGVTALSSGYAQINTGVSDLANGIAQLDKSTGTLSIDVAEKINEMISSYTSKGYQPTSFVSAKNAKVENLQFIIRTDSISIPDAAVETPVAEEELTFWQRILKLFGL